jgi:hypothetical protein
MDGINGRIVRLDDAPGFISAALALAGDPALRSRLGQSARQTMLPLDWSCIVQQFEAVLQEVLAQPLAADVRAYPRVVA